jgi:hypothetical protein
VEFFSRGSRLAAWGAGVLFVLNPLNLIYSQFIQPEGLWRDLIVIWVFSLVLLLQRKKWAVFLGAASLGVLWLSRNSALPSLLLMTTVGGLAAWKRITIWRYLVITAAVIGVINAPYGLYLRLAGTYSQTYFMVWQSVGSFLARPRSLDRYTPCFGDFQVDFTQQTSTTLPWMKTPLFSPFNPRDPTAKTSAQLAGAFVKCVYPADYLRFPTQQLGILVNRTGHFLWSSDLRDADLWDYGKIYTQGGFFPADRMTVLANVPSVAPYIDQAKWASLGAPSLWAAVFSVLYKLWPAASLLVLVLSILLVLLGFTLPNLRKSTAWVEARGLMAALGMLYAADALIYAVFGIVFYQRIMVASAPLVLIVFGSSLGMVISSSRVQQVLREKVFRRKPRKQEPPPNLPHR